MILVYSTELQIFIMFVSIQLAIFLFACLIEYIILWMTHDDERKGLGTLRNYWILLFIILLPLAQGIMEFIIGMYDISHLFTSLFLVWLIVLVWLLGKVFVRQIYMIRPPSEIKNFSQD